MGQRFFEDKIGVLTHLAGTATLAPSRLTIGGQQYITTALPLVLAGLGSSALYMIYAVNIAGTITLVQSTNVNSVGPAGHAAWKLVGAFYSSGASAFGAFVTIEGRPQSGIVEYTPSLTSSGGGAITLNATGQVAPWGRFWRDGELIHIRTGFQNGSGGAATGAAGNMIMGWPTGVAQAANAAAVPDIAVGVYLGAGARTTALAAEPSVATYRVHGENMCLSTQGGTLLTLSGLVASYAAQFDATFAVTGWTNTPLKDL